MTDPSICIYYHNFNNLLIMSMSQKLRSIQNLLEQQLLQMGFKVNFQSAQLLVLEYKGLELNIHWRQLLTVADEEDAEDIVVEKMMLKIMAYLEPSSSISQFYPRWIPYVSSKPTHHPWTTSVIENFLELAIVSHCEGVLTFMTPLKIIQHPLGLKGLKNEAMRNLRHLSQNVGLELIKDGLWGWESLEGMAASMLLVSEVLPEGDFWVGMPTRDHLWICTDSQLLGEFQFQIASAYQRLSHPLLPQSFSWNRQQSIAISHLWLQ